MAAARSTKDVYKRQVYERGAEDNNQAPAEATLHVARIDLSVSAISVPASIPSGNLLHVAWTVRNDGGIAPGNWTDQVFLARDGVLRLSLIHI